MIFIYYLCKNKSVNNAVRKDVKRNVIHYTSRKYVVVLERAKWCAQARMLTSRHRRHRTPAARPRARRTSPRAPRALTDSVINKPYRRLLVRHAASLTSRPGTQISIHASLFTYNTAQVSPSVSVMCVPSV